MPYLPQKFRDELDRQVDVHYLRDYLSSLQLKDFLGALNYLIFSMAKHYLDKNGKSYATLASITGTIECSKQEIYRRIAGPYEDLKIEENGDV